MIILIILKNTFTYECVLKTSYFKNDQYFLLLFLIITFLLSWSKLPSSPSDLLAAVRLN